MVTKVELRACKHMKIDITVVCSCGHSVSHNSFGCLLDALLAIIRHPVFQRITYLDALCPNPGLYSGCGCDWSKTTKMTQYPLVIGQVDRHHS